MKNPPKCSTKPRRSAALVAGMRPTVLAAARITFLTCAAFGAPTTAWGIEPDNTLVEASSLGTLDPAQALLGAGTIGDGDFPTMDVDYYALELLEATGVVLLTLNVRTEDPLFDPAARLFDGVGTELARNDDRVFGERNAEVRHYLVAPGTYYVGVSDTLNPNADPNVAGSGRETGAFGFYQVSAAIAAVAIPVSPYEPNDEVYAATDMGGASFAVTGEFIGDGLHGPMDVDIYKLSTDGAARIDARINTVPIWPILQPVLRLRSCEEPIVDLQPMDPCGLGESIPPGQGGSEATVSTLVLEAGTVYITVSGDGNRRYNPAMTGSGELGSMGPYDLEVVVTPFSPYGPGEPNDSVSQAAEQPFPFIDGRPSTITYEGFLGDGAYAITRGDRDFYQIVVTDEDRFVTVEVEADDPLSGLRPVVAVYDQARRLIAVDENPGETATARLTVPVVCNVTSEDASPVYVMVMSTRQDWPGDPRVPIQSHPSRQAPVDLTSGRGTGTTGSYQLRVTASAVEESCGDEPNDTLATAVQTGLVDEGDWACFGGFMGDSACAAPVQDVDLYSVVVTRAPMQLRVGVSTCAPVGVAVCYFSVAVTDSSGEVLARIASTGDCYGTFAVPPILLPSVGTYYVGVFGDQVGTFDPHVACSLGPASASGPYGLTLSLTPGRLGVFVDGPSGTTAGEPTAVDELFATRMDDAANHIDVLDPATLLPLRSFPAPEPSFGGSEGLASDGGYLYYVGVGRYPLMYRLDPRDGTVLETTLLWMGSGFYSDAAILQHTLYIMDFGAHAIHLFDLTAQRYAATWPIGWWNGIGLGGGLAAMEGPNRLYAADAFGTGSVYELHPSSGAVTGVIDLQSASNQRPVTLASNGAGELLMADRASDTVDVLQRDGTRLESVTLDAPVASIGGLSSVAGIADINGDGNVDLRDYAWLQDCFDPSGLPVRPGCADADQNADGHVDAADTAVLVTTFTGP